MPRTTPTTSNFRMQGSHFSLTWPMADFSMEDCIVYLRNSNQHLTYVVICSETHDSGDLHRHAYLKFSKKQDIRNPRKFDFANKHCNIQRTANVHAWINYVKKDNQFLEWSAETGEAESLYDQARSMSREAFMTKSLKGNVSYAYALDAWNSVNNDSEQITIVGDPNPTLQHVYGPELSQYELSTELTNVIVGPTGCGKTTYALRHGQKPLLFITHLDQLKHMTSQVNCIIFDDMTFSHLPITSQIHLVDRTQPRAIHRRYGTSLIPAGVQIIMTCNERPLTWHPAIERRLNYLLIN